MARVYNRFRILLAEKAAQEQRNISLNEVHRITGISWPALQRWANNEVTRFDETAIASLCDYLDCSVGDLIIYDRNQDYLS